MSARIHLASPAEDIQQALTENRRATAEVVASMDAFGLDEGGLSELEYDRAAKQFADLEAEHVQLVRLLRGLDEPGLVPMPRLSVDDSLPAPDAACADCGELDCCCDPDRLPGGFGWARE